MYEVQETWVQSQGQEDPMEEEMATHSSILENPMDRGAWWAIVYGVTKSQAQLSNWTHTPEIYNIHGWLWWDFVMNYL